MFYEDATPVDVLEQQIVALERGIGSLRARQLDLLARLDAAQVTLMDGSRTMTEWVAARCDVSHDTARQLTKAMAALTDQPAVAEDLASGEVTFDRAVATARLANQGASEAVVAASAGYDIDGVHRLAARLRRVTRRDEQQAHAGRHLSMQPALDGLSGRVWGELFGTDYVIFEKAVEQRADELPPAPHPESRGTRRSDAVVSIMADSLYGNGTGAGSENTPVVSVFVDADLAAATAGESGAELATGPRIGPHTLEELLCTGRINAIAVFNGMPVATTRSQRAIPPAIRRYALFRDGGCTIGGCRSRYRLQPHHIMAWAPGGDHSPANLATLCWYHHHVCIHQGGYRIDPDSSPNSRRLIRPRTSGHDPP